MSFVPRTLRASFAIPFVLLAVGVAMTLLVAALLRTQGDDRDTRRFEDLAGTQRNRIEARMEAFTHMVRGTADLFQSAQSVSAKQFRTHVAIERIAERCPGMLGLGFAREFPGSAKRAFGEELTALQGPGHALHPNRDATSHTGVLYFEAEGRVHRTALGYDLATVAGCRDAMDRARDSGLPAVSFPMLLTPEMGEAGQTGFVVVAAVYDRDVSEANLAERREALVGFAYAPCLAAGFLGNLFDEYELGAMAVSLHAVGPYPVHGAPIAIRTRGWAERTERIVEGPLDAAPP